MEFPSAMEGFMEITFKPMPMNNKLNQNNIKTFLRMKLTQQKPPVLKQSLLNKALVYY